VRPTGPVVSVLNGDTIEVLHNQHPERIRSAALTVQRKAKPTATERSKRPLILVFGKDVTLQTHGLDKYGRTLADGLLSDGMNLNQELVKQGWC